MMLFQRFLAFFYNHLETVDFVKTAIQQVFTHKEITGQLEFPQGPLLFAFHKLCAIGLQLVRHFR